MQGAQPQLSIAASFPTQTRTIHHLPSTAPPTPSPTSEHKNQNTQSLNAHQQDPLGPTRMNANANIYRCATMLTVRLTFPTEPLRPLFTRPCPSRDALTTSRSLKHATALDSVIPARCRSPQNLKALATHDACYDTSWWCKSSERDTHLARHISTLLCAIGTFIVVDVTQLADPRHLRTKWACHQNGVTRTARLFLWSATAASAAARLPLGRLPKVSETRTISGTDDPTGITCWWLVNGAHVFPHVLSLPLRVDKDRSGAISMDELQQALANGIVDVSVPSVLFHRH